MTTRRTILQGLAALPVAAVPAIIPDRVVAAPIAQLRAEVQLLTAWINQDGIEHTDEDADLVADRIGAMERQAAAMVPTTRAEALVALDWASYEAAEARLSGDRADNFIVDMLGSVSTYVRRLSNGGAA